MMGNRLGQEIVETPSSVRSAAASLISNSASTSARLTG